MDFGYLDCLRTPPAKPHSCREPKRFTEALDPFYARASKDPKFCMEKTPARANWRFFDRPNSFHTVYATGSAEELTGYVVLKQRREPDGYRETHIHALDSDALSHLIAAESYAENSDELNLWAAQGRPYCPGLGAIDFVPRSRQPLVLRSYNMSPAPACSRIEIHNIEGW